MSRRSDEGVEMLERLGQLGRASGNLVTAPLRKLWSVADDSGREFARVVSNGPLQGVVTNGSRFRGGDSRFRDDEDQPDVLLDVPLLKVDEIELEVENLEARVSLQAELADLVKIHVGADVHLGKVHLDIKGVEAQALLKVRLDQVAAILDRALTTLDNNPQILEKAVEAAHTAAKEVSDTAETAAEEVGGTAQEALGEGGAASQAVDQVGGTAQEAVGEGGAVSEAATQAGEAAGQAAQGAGEAAQGAGQAAGDAAQGAGQAAGDAGQAAGDAAQAAGEGAAETAQGAGQAGQAAAGQAAGGAAEAGEQGGAGDHPDATDAARRQAQESGVDLSSLEGTGSGGRITVGDVRGAAGDQ